MEERTQELTRAGEALRRAHDELESRVEERTRELTRAGLETRRTQQFLNSIVENIPNMIFVKDAQDLRFVSFNRAGEELLGYPRADLIGKGDGDFFPRRRRAPSSPRTGPCWSRGG